MENLTDYFLWALLASIAHLLLNRSTRKAGSTGCSPRCPNIVPLLVSDARDHKQGHHFLFSSPERGTHCTSQPPLGKAGCETSSGHGLPEEMTDTAFGSRHLVACAKPFSTLFLYLGDEKPLVPDGAAANHRAFISLGARDSVVQHLVRLPAKHM